MFGAVLIAALGVIAIVIGIQGFMAKGLPLTARKRLIGPPAKVVGICSALLGCAMLIAGVALIIFVGNGRVR